MSKMKKLILVAALICLAARSRDANNIVSSARPHVVVTVPAGASYVGTDQFKLYGLADCQIFVFVDADAMKSVRRLYWIQFERYLPQYSKLSYDYDSRRTAPIGGRDFLVDEWFKASESLAPPQYEKFAEQLASIGYASPPGLRSGSDEQHVFALIKRAGYRMTAGRASVRLVHLSGDRREELMLIYSEVRKKKPASTLLPSALRSFNVRWF